MLWAACAGRAGDRCASSGPPQSALTMARVRAPLAGPTPLGLRPPARPRWAASLLSPPHPGPPPGPGHPLCAFPLPGSLSQGLYPRATHCAPSLWWEAGPCAWWGLEEAPCLSHNRDQEGTELPGCELQERLGWGPGHQHRPRGWLGSVRRRGEGWPLGRRWAAARCQGRARTQTRGHSWAVTGSMGRRG